MSAMAPKKKNEATTAKRERAGADRRHLGVNSTTRAEAAAEVARDRKEEREWRRAFPPPEEEARG